jgi:hypothetical protein
MSTRLKIHTACAVVVLLFAIWLSSGTLTPYAASVEYPKFSEPCHYIVSVDHYHFLAIFLMVKGEDMQLWLGSVMLRRLLFAVIALPFVNVLGLMVGGVVASMVIHVVAVTGFGWFVHRRTGERAAVVALWLLATYPGITYWSGLPYSYATIVPGSIAAMILLYRLHDAAALRDVVMTSLLLGVVYLGYDLFAFFAPAAILILGVRRRFAAVVCCMIAMATPLLLLALAFRMMGVPVVNSSTGNYFAVLSAYLHPESIGAWMRNIAEMPIILLSNFIFGNFAIMPVLFCAVVFVAKRRKQTLLHLPEWTLLGAALAIFLFNNAAPPHYGWQLRGHWIARLYQPIFPALLLVIGRAAQVFVIERWFRAAIGASIVAQASIAFGPVMMNPIAAYAYTSFYTQGPPLMLLDNLRKYGRRPLGVCDTSHHWDDVPDPNTPWNRPSYMYRYPPKR